VSRAVARKLTPASAWKAAAIAGAAIGLSIALPVCPAAGQEPPANPLEAPDAAEQAREALEAWHEAAIGPLRERLAAELHFIDRACSLSEDQSRELREAAEEIVSREDQRLAKALKNAAFTDLPEIGAEDVAIGPASALVVPGESLRAELDQAVKRLFPAQVSERLASERAGLESRVRRATVDALLAALDEAMLLSAAQRAAMRDTIEVRGAGGGWLPPSTWERFVWPQRGRRHSTMARSALALLHVSRIELLPFLRPSQMTVAREARIYARQLELPLSDRQPHVELSLEAVAADCDLSDEQLAKLRLAAKLDIGERASDAFSIPPRQRQRAAGDDELENLAGLLPVAAGPADFPRYIKAVRHVLSPEQATALEAARQERWQFYRAADLQTIVVLFARRLLLIDEQCQRLARRLEAELESAGRCPHSRSDLVVRLARIPDETWSEMFDEFQRPSAEALLAELREVAKKCEAEHDRDR
jgi:hypothetical protein